jgi:3',5'-cyclic AMP phosphodiesterase CpdA
MRKVVHISDIHFGRVDESTVAPLIREINAVGPDLVVVSGDLTQRARAGQFREARRFLDALPQPQLVVPGNHDVPLYNVAARFLAPFHNYRKFVSDDLEPHFADAEIVVQGINTARSLTWKNGRINREQIELARQRFAAAAPGAVRILVTHHPLDLPQQFDGSRLVGRARLAVPLLAETGVDVLLAGHYHISHTGDTTTRYRIAGFSALVVQSGTSTSTRLRDEPNAFNLLHIAGNDIAVDRYAWRPEDAIFLVSVHERFHRTAGGWKRIDRAAD